MPTNNTSSNNSSSRSYSNPTFHSGFGVTTASVTSGSGSGRTTTVLSGPSQSSSSSSTSQSTSPTTTGQTSTPSSASGVTQPTSMQSSGVSSSNVYYSPNQNWTPKNDKNAVVIYTSGNKTTGTMNIGGQSQPFISGLNIVGAAGTELTSAIKSSIQQGGAQPTTEVKYFNAKGNPVYGNIGEKVTPPKGATALIGISSMEDLGIKKTNDNFMQTLPNGITSISQPQQSSMMQPKTGSFFTGIMPQSVDNTKTSSFGIFNKNVFSSDKVNQQSVDVNKKEFENAPKYFQSLREKYGTDLTLKSGEKNPYWVEKAAYQAKLTPEEKMNPLMLEPEVRNKMMDLNISGKGGNFVSDFLMDVKDKGVFNAITGKYNIAAKADAAPKVDGGIYNPIMVQQAKRALELEYQNQIKTQPSILDLQRQSFGGKTIEEVKPELDQKISMMAGILSKYTPDPNNPNVYPFTEGDYAMVKGIEKDINRISDQETQYNKLIDKQNAFAVKLNADFKKGYESFDKNDPIYKQIAASKEIGNQAWADKDYAKWALETGKQTGMNIVDVGKKTIIEMPLKLAEKTAQTGREIAYDPSRLKSFEYLNKLNPITQGMITSTIYDKRDNIVNEPEFSWAGAASKIDLTLPTAALNIALAGQGAVAAKEIGTQIAKKGLAEGAGYIATASAKQMAKDSLKVLPVVTQVAKAKLGAEAAGILTEENIKEYGISARGKDLINKDYNMFVEAMHIGDANAQTPHGGKFGTWEGVKSFAAQVPGVDLVFRNRDTARAAIYEFARSKGMNDTDAKIYADAVDIMSYKKAVELPVAIGANVYSELKGSGFVSELASRNRPATFKQAFVGITKAALPEYTAIKTIGEAGDYNYNYLQNYLTEGAAVSGVAGLLGASIYRGSVAMGTTGKPIMNPKTGEMERPKFFKGMATRNTGQNLKVGGGRVLDIASNITDPLEKIGDKLAEAGIDVSKTVAGRYSASVRVPTKEFTNTNTRMKNEEMPTMIKQSRVALRSGSPVQTKNEINMQSREVTPIKQNIVQNTQKTPAKVLELVDIKLPDKTTVTEKTNVNTSERTSSKTETPATIEERAPIQETIGENIPIQEKINTNINENIGVPVKGFLGMGGLTGAAYSSGGLGGGSGAYGIGRGGKASWNINNKIRDLGAEFKQRLNMRSPFIASMYKKPSTRSGSVVARYLTSKKKKKVVGR